MLPMKKMKFAFCRGTKINVKTNNLFLQLSPILTWNIFIFCKSRKKHEKDVSFLYWYFLYTRSSINVHLVTAALTTHHYPFPYIWKPFIHQCTHPSIHFHICTLAHNIISPNNVLLEMNKFHCWKKEKFLSPMTCLWLVRWKCSKICTTRVRYCKNVYVWTTSPHFLPCRFSFLLFLQLYIYIYTVPFTTFFAKHTVNIVLIFDVLCVGGGTLLNCFLFPSLFS